MTQPSIAAEQQTTANDQHDGEAYLKAHDGFAKTQPRAAAGRGGACLEIAREVRAGGTERGQQSKQQNGARADGECEGEEAPVHARSREFADCPIEVAAAGERGWDAQERHDPRRRQERQDTRGGSEDSALDEHLANRRARLDPMPAGSRSRRRAGSTDEQAGDVGAGNEKEHGGRSRQQHQGASRDDVDPRVVQCHSRGQNSSCGVSASLGCSA